MPSPRKPRTSVVRRKRCTFQEGSMRCTDPGTGTPSLCDEHRAAIGRKPGLGEQLGGIFEQVVRGKNPTARDIESVMANFAAQVLGREVTIEEIHKIRTGVQNGVKNPHDVDHDKAYAQWQMYQQQVKERFRQYQQEKARQSPKSDPAADRARIIYQARVVMGFGQGDPIDESMIKARHRELARKHHPDRGGDVEVMQRVNGAVEVLLGTL